MNSFHFQEGSLKLLDSCEHLWELFISNQTQNAGEMSAGIEEYIRSLKNGGLLNKTINGQIHVQLVNVNDNDEPIAFCITSITEDLVGEVEVLFVLESYQGNKLGGKLFEKALSWMEQKGAVEQKLFVAVGNEKVFDFYAKYNFFPGYTTLFRAI